MLYNVGMYGGSFDPPHMGHMNVIMQAASMCKELHLIISYSPERDNIDYKQRYQWLRCMTKDAVDNIIIHCVKDNAMNKCKYDWKSGATDIKNAVGKHIDIVFCGSDYLKTGIFEELYPSSIIKYIDRDELGINISSTDIRNNPYKHWEYIPNIIKPYYTKKILIVGGESTGKSTLVRKLATAFNTTYLQEVGRDICDRAGTEEFMLETDFYEILMKHKQLEYEKLAQANKVLFIDTDAITTLFYSKLLCNNREIIKAYSEIAYGMSKINQYDLIIFLEPNGVGFVQDGTRNENIEKNREYYSNVLKTEMDSMGFKYITISGDYAERYNKALNLVRNLMKTDIN